jgi:hypothetical protein
VGRRKLRYGLLWRLDRLQPPSIASRSLLETDRLSRQPVLFGLIVAVSVSENKFGGSVVVVDQPETAGSSE